MRLSSILGPNDFLQTRIRKETLPYARMEPGSDRDLGGFGPKWSWGESGHWGGGGDTKVVRVRAADGESENRENQKVIKRYASVSLQP